MCAPPSNRRSVAKDTCLKDPDLDIFILFPPEVPLEELKDKGMAIARSIIDGEEKYAQHPYLNGTFEGFEVDMVPAYKLKDTTDLMTAVDRTPFHVRYINNTLMKEQRDEAERQERSEPKRDRAERGSGDLPQTEEDRCRQESQPGEREGDGQQQAPVAPLDGILQQEGAQVVPQGEGAASDHQGERKRDEDRQGPSNVGERAPAIGGLGRRRGVERVHGIRG